ncbi:MAG: histone deacetylase family protein [bacterium]
MIFFSEKCLEYQAQGHPESPERVKATHDYLKEKGFSFQQAQVCSGEDLLLVHTRSFLKKVKENRFFDADTPNIDRIYDYAIVSVGGAVEAMKKALEEEPSFSLLRPPGHHAGKDYLGGFCYVNNMAIAVIKALEKVERVAIIDFDGHHGNGTEDIFLGHRRVAYLSLHQYPAYPGTGEASQKNCLNYPLSPGTGEERYLQIFSEGLEKVETFDPALIGVSAGFDGYKGDRLLSLELEVKTYYDIGRSIKDLGRPCFAILEGGYSSDLPLCVYQFLQGIGVK